MVARGRGGGVTPKNVVELLQAEVASTSQAATARATGLTLQTVQRYIKGIGEPSTATLEKLAVYFRKSVAWLRGGNEISYIDEQGEKYLVEIFLNDGKKGQDNVQLPLSLINDIGKSVAEFMLSGASDEQTLERIKEFKGRLELTIEIPKT